MEFKGVDTGFGLGGKVALITGGAAGIGLAVAKLFAEKGARVVLVDMAENVSEIAREVAGENGHGLRADLTDSSQIAEMSDAAIAQFGQVDILVNSAGVAILEPAETASEAGWDKTMAINLKALFLVSQTLGRHMIARGSGKIVNLASQAGLVALPNHVAYCTSKAGVISMTKVMAMEWGPKGVQVNAISPTVVLTELGRKAWAGEVGEAMKQKIPAGRFAYPEEIAACALFLASGAADMITGENLVIDGGYTIQ